MYFYDTWTKKELEVQESLVSETNVHILKLLLKQSNVDFQNIENPDQFILKISETHLDKIERLKLEWSFSILFQ